MKTVYIFCKIKKVIPTTYVITSNVSNMEKISFIKDVFQSLVILDQKLYFVDQ